jgi:hypothetical protein
MILSIPEFTKYHGYKLFLRNLIEGKLLPPKRWL